MPHRFAGPETLACERGRLVVLGDTQRVLPIEFWSRPQDKLQRVLVDAVLNLEPDGVLHCGDIVAIGGSRRHWTRFDQTFGPWREAGLPLLPVLGNHDRMWHSPKARGHLAKRFPWLAERSYHRLDYGPLAILGLDSNRRLWPGDSHAEQHSWLEDTLNTLDDSPDLKALLGYWHHPAFTNSMIVRPSKRSLNHFAFPLLAHPLFALGLSGHAHAYEHFRHEQAHFVVSGGGGGPLHRLRHPKRRRYTEHYPDQRRLGFMHFCELTLSPIGIQLTAHRISDASTARVDSFHVPWPTQVPAHDNSLEA